MAQVCRTLWKWINHRAGFLDSQFLTFAVIDYAPYTFPVIYHSFYLPSHSCFFGSAVFLEIYLVVYSVLPGERRGTEATANWRLSD